MVVLETDLTRFDEHMLDDMIRRLPSSWQKRVVRKKTFRARLQSAVGYTLLLTALQEHFSLTTFPDIDTDANGKPFFKNCPLFFSISHCNIAVACAIDDSPIAVDIQDILTDPKGHLKVRIGAPLDLDDRALTTLWTQKEASAKLDGRGLAIGLAQLPLAEHRLQTTAYPTFIVTIATKSAEASL